MGLGSRTMRASVAVLFILFGVSSAIDHLRVAYQWKQMEYDWPNEQVKMLFPEYKQEDNLPLGLEVAGDKLFITVPRWKRGVIASLNYIKLNDTRQSPPLMPYPSWEAHQYSGGAMPEMISTFRIRADRCNRLWVLDTGLNDILGTPEQQAPPSLLVYDLTNDNLMRKIVIPEDQRNAESLFANIAVEDYSCDDTYAYLGDLGGSSLVVYSWKEGKTWMVKHHYFQPDPQSGDFNVSGIPFHWSDGVFGLALEPTGDGYSTLYFHPLSSKMEFSVSTQLLRDHEALKQPDLNQKFKVLGTRGPNGQSSVSFLDPKTGILIYALTNLNAIACWRTGTEYTIQQQGRVYMDNVTMVFPNDLKIDRMGNIWVLSDRLPAFMYSHLDPNDYNFRVLTGTVEEAIQGTVCATGMPTTTSSSGIMRMPKATTNVTKLSSTSELMLNSDGHIHYRQPESVAGSTTMSTNLLVQLLTLAIVTISFKLAV